MVSEVIEVMDSYHLMKEDWDSILEVGQFEGKAKLQSSIDSKVSIIDMLLGTLRSKTATPTATSF